MHSALHGLRVSGLHCSASREAGRRQRTRSKHKQTAIASAVGGAETRVFVVTILYPLHPHPPTFYGGL